MGANTPARQHYIPSMLLRNFIDDKGRLWVYDKNQMKIYPTNVKNAFVQRDLYTTYIFENDEKYHEFEDFVDSIRKNYTYETEYFSKKIEGKASSVIFQIIEKARSGQVPRLSVEQAAIWKSFVLSMARRTPESRRRATSISDDDAFCTAVKSRADEVNFDLPDREILYQDPRVLKLRDLVMANVHAKFAAGDSPRERIEEDKFRRETGLCVATIIDPNPKKSFVIGSHGLAIVQSDHSSDAPSGSWLPIAYDVVVLATNSPDKEFLLTLDERVVQSINTASHRCSQVIAGRSVDAVRAFLV